MAQPKISVDGDRMTIEVDLSEKGSLSASEKTLVISSTHGNQVVETDSGPVSVGLNVYRKNPDYKK